MKKLVVLTGAGISKESGIDTFRDANGLWYDYKVEEVAHIDGWRKDKQKVLDFYNKRRAQLKDVKPNSAHINLAMLEQWFDVSIITQNVDDLHERAGSTNVLHLHGELVKACSSNNKRHTVHYDNDIKLGDKHEDGSQLRPFIVWFGEDVPNITEAVRIVSKADILVIIGTSMEVYPAAGLYAVAPLSTPIYVINPVVKALNEDSCFQEYENSKIIYIDKPATTGMVEFIQHLQKLK